MEENELAGSATAEAPEQTPQAEPPASETTTDSSEKPNRVQKRIDQLTGEKYALQSDRDYWRQKALEAEKSSPAPAPEAPKRPQVADYDGDLEAYATALADYTDQQVKYRVTQATQDAIAAAKQTVQTERSAQTQAEIDAAWNARMAEATEKHDDFSAIALNPTIPINESMAEVIKASENGPELLYHLGRHPEKAARIAQQTPAQAAASLGRLEAELAKPGNKPVSNAPPPPKPVEGGSEAPANNDPMKGDMSHYVALRRKQRAAR